MGMMMNPHDTSFKLAFIGAGNMASALAAGLIGKRCGGSEPGPDQATYLGLCRQTPGHERNRAGL